LRIRKEPTFRFDRKDLLLIRDLTGRDLSGKLNPSLCIALDRYYQTRKIKLRQEINSLTEKFLASGGVVKRLPLIYKKTGILDLSNWQREVYLYE